jgi:hypothetical protein
MKCEIPLLPESLGTPCLPSTGGSVLPDQVFGPPGPELQALVHMLWAPELPQSTLGQLNCSTLSFLLCCLKFFLGSVKGRTSSSESDACQEDFDGSSGFPGGTPSPQVGM